MSLLLLLLVVVLLVAGASDSSAGAGSEKKSSSSTASAAGFDCSADDSGVAFGCSGDCALVLVFAVLNNYENASSFGAGLAGPSSAARFTW